jgi:hypothetical protein
MLQRRIKPIKKENFRGVLFTQRVILMQKRAYSFLFLSKIGISLFTLGISSSDCNYIKNTELRLPTADRFNDIIIY